MAQTVLMMGPFVWVVAEGSSSSGKSLPIFGWFTPASVESWTIKPSSNSNKSMLTSGPNEVVLKNLVYNLSTFS